MKRPTPSYSLVRQSALPRETFRQVAALCLLLAMGAWAVMGPSGLVAWGENYHLLVQKQQQLARLTAERDELKNRVNLLDPTQVNADLTGELLRSNLNVISPDEMVLQLHH